MKIGSLTFNEHPLFLAPMEDVTDIGFRMLCKRYGAAMVYTEFVSADAIIRNIQSTLNKMKINAEERPVGVQIYGRDVDSMVEAARVVEEIHPDVIDLNFGCPAKTVNNHKGGSVLLEEPKTLYTIIRTVRDAIPTQIPVSAKIRLGYTDTSQSAEIGHAVADARADWLTVHARTKVDGYKPPAYWEKIAPFNDLGLPIIANGEIWNAGHARRCIAQSQTHHLMLGRGAVTRPDLTAIIAGKSDLGWADLCQHQLSFINDITDNQNGLIGRYKQWLAMLTKGYTQAHQLWQAVKKLKNKSDIEQLIIQSTHHH